jgi:PAS domain S-box-containing protein
MKRLRILHLEDSPLDAELIHAALSGGGLECEITRVQTRADFVTALENGGFDLVLADYSLPAFDGLSALKAAQEIRPEVPFVLVSGALGEERAIEALKEGATDYVLKQRLERIVPAVRRAISEFEERTERKRAEEALRESEERFRATFEQAAVGISHNSLDGRWLRVNQKLCEIIGYSREELLEKTFQDITHPYDLEADLEQVHQLLAGNIETYSMEKRYIKKDGSIVWINLTVSLVRERWGEAKNFIAVIEDITERKRAEEALQEIREAERQRIAHDLHDGALQDLTYILAETRRIQEISKDPQLDHRLERSIEALQLTTRELRSAVYNLSRLEEQQDRPLLELLKSIVNLNQEMTSEGDVLLEVEDGFPSSPLGKRDPELLRIVQEALTNARKHSEACRVMVVLGAEGGMIWVEVSDNGRGFGQGGSQGVGLSSMRERARALGGDLKIESEPGKGTKVRFEMALEKDGEDAGEEKDIGILLVEDHSSFREAVASVLEQEPGFEVAGQAGSLTEARKMLENEAAKVDVAILDLGLPDGYGTDLINELREKNPEAQALVLSASLDQDDLAQAVEAGAAGVLHKSVGMEEVVEATRRLQAGETLLPLEDVVDFLRFASVRKKREHEARQAIAQLTDREKEVLQALAEGLDGKEIAERLSISDKTERNHIANILAKLGVHSRLQALVFALRYDIVELG